MSRIIIARMLVPFVLAFLLPGCATRGPRSPVATVSSEISMEEQMAREYTAIWRDDLAKFLEREELDWATRLSQLRDMQSRNGLRPGRISFTTLAAGGDPDSADAFDVVGLLLGRQSVGRDQWFLFVVGVVERDDFRPVEIRDVRLIAFESGGSDPLWVEGEADARSLELYKETYKYNIPIRFPDDDDSYQVDLVGDRVTVRELRSGAEWTLLLKADR